MGAFLLKQLGPFEWSETRAFVGVHNDLWLNVAGREPDGMVAPEDADRVLDEILAGLLAITDPATGGPVFAGAHRRAEIYSGAAVGLAPDAILDCWSNGYRVAVKREPSEEVVIPPASLAGVDEPWSSDHRPEGIFVAAGPNVVAGHTAPTGEAPDRSHTLSLYDVAPTTLALLGQAIPEGLDGRVAEDALTPEFLRSHPITVADRSEERAAGGGYSDDEANAVAAHLKDLGYID